MVSWGQRLGIPSLQPRTGWYELLVDEEDVGPGPQVHSGAQDSLSVCSCTSDAQKSSSPSLLLLPPLLWGLWTSVSARAS